MFAILNVVARFIYHDLVRYSNSEFGNCNLIGFIRLFYKSTGTFRMYLFIFKRVPAGS